jgi:iron complex outermembrane receptor protein
MQYEVGTKLSFLDERVSLTLDAFHVTRSNVFTLFADAPVFNDQKTDGIEASIDAQPTPRWHIQANATLENGVVTNDPDNRSAVGNRPQGVPGRIFNLWTSYKFAIDGLDGFQIGGGVTYRDKIYSSALDINQAPSYAVANAEIGYETDKWDVMLNLRNITNTRYFIAANNGGAFVGEPFSVFLGARIHY